MTKLFTVPFTLALAALAMAQTSFDREVCDITLLQTKEVKQELKVTDAQRSRMNAASAGYNAVAKRVEEKMRKNQEPSEADKKQMSEQFDKMRIAVLNVLNEGQIRRLREISLQTAGLIALTDPAVIRKVGLSQAQVTKVKNYLKTSYEAAGDLTKQVQEKVAKEFKNRNPKTDAEKRKLADQYTKRMKEEMAKITPKLEKIRSDGRANIMKTLSEGQRTIWNSLLGKPFNP